MKRISIPPYRSSNAFTVLVFTAVCAFFIAHGITTPAERVFVPGGIFMIVFGVVFVFPWGYADEVFDFGSYLRVRKGRRQVNIAFSEIMTVTWARTSRAIVLTLARPSSLGAKVIFAPVGAFSRTAGEELADQLVARVDSARVERPADRVQSPRQTRAPRKISSGYTVYMKKVVPPVAFIAAVVSLWMDLAGPPTKGFYFSVLVAAVGCFLVWPIFLVDVLDEVVDHGDWLDVRRGRKRLRIDLSQVVNVEATNSESPRVTLTLAGWTELGDKVTFLPALRSLGMPNEELIREIATRADAARTRKVQARKTASAA